MTPQPPHRSLRRDAVFNIVTGLLFLAAAFNLLAGRDGFDWGSVIVGLLFVGGGLRGLWAARG